MDARNGVRVDGVHRDAVRGGAALPSWVPSLPGSLVLRTTLLYLVRRQLAEGAIIEATEEPEGMFLLIERLHRVLLAISILTVLGAVAGSHGMLF